MERTRRVLDEATIEQLKQRGIEFVQVPDRDAILMPKDAGLYHDWLLEIMLRIPNGWGRRIRVERGWYPLTCDLDKRLAELFPDYVLHQVKQKFGSLNYNWVAPPAPTDDDEIAERERRIEIANALVSEAEQRSHTICELCGAGGEASQSDRPAPWILILCDACRPLASAETAYLTVPVWREKYGAAESLHLPRTRGRA